jgi:hypothetical protein
MRSAAPISSHPSTALRAAHAPCVRVAFPHLAISSFRPQFHRPVTAFLQFFDDAHPNSSHPHLPTTPSTLHSTALHTEQNPLKAELPVKV